MSIETRLTKLEAISSPDGPVIFFWSMKGSRQMTAREIDSGIAALKAKSPNARVMSVSWEVN
jgi:hypothetical protein